MKYKNYIFLDPIIAKLNPYGGIYRYWSDLKQGLCDIGIQCKEVDLWRIDKRASFERYYNFKICTDRPSIAHSSYYRRPSVKNKGVKSVITAYDCIYERYRSGLALKTHISTNLTFTELAERYGIPIADRLKEMCTIIEFKGESLRTK